MILPETGRGTIRNANGGGGGSLRKPSVYVVRNFARKARLTIEIDGSPHDYGNRPRRDEARDAYLMQLGYRILRLAAGDVMKDVDAALKYIVAEVANPLHHQASLDGPPPHAGEEF